MACSTYGYAAAPSYYDICSNLDFDEAVAILAKRTVPALQRRSLVETMRRKAGEFLSVRRPTIATETLRVQRPVKPKRAVGVSPSGHRNLVDSPTAAE